MDTSEHGPEGRKPVTPTREAEARAKGVAAPPSDVDPLVAEARRIFALQRDYRWTVARSTADERIDKLDRLRRAIVANRERLYAAMRADFHKPELEVELTEIQPTLVEIDHARRHLDRWMRPRRVGTPWILAGTRSYVRYEPKGIVLIMAPWNYPFSLLIEPLVASVAAGNCAILRPSEKVPRTSEVLVDIVRDSFDEREVACLTEPGITLATALLELPVDHVFFTGSVRVGRIVMAAAAKHLASVTLELGGKSPLIVDETTDLAETARRAMWGKLINAGQTCIAPDYALVPEDRLDAFVAEARRAVESFYGEGEAARRDSPSFPRLIDPQAFERLSGLLRDSIAQGARVAMGGDVDASERYIAPTLVTDLDWDSPLMQEELFGPILPVLTYRDIDGAIAEINARGKPLAIYVFSESRRFIQHVLESTTSGGAAVNNTVLHFANPNLPFGGVGESGMGSYHGEFGFRTFSHERAVLRQRRGNLTSYFYPPYDGRKQRRLRLFSRMFG